MYTSGRLNLTLARGSVKKWKANTYGHPGKETPHVAVCHISGGAHLSRLGVVYVFLPSISSGRFLIVPPFSPIL